MSIKACLVLHTSKYDSGITVYNNQALYENKLKIRLKYLHKYQWIEWEFVAEVEVIPHFELIIHAVSRNNKYTNVHRCFPVISQYKVMVLTMALSAVDKCHSFM